MIEAIKKHWKSIVLTVLVIITLVGICLSVYQGGYCVTSKFAGNVEAKLSSVSVKDTVVSYEDYMSLYSGVTSVVGNYITGIAAFLTLVLLTLQYHEIRVTKKRYEEGKKIEKITREKDDVDRFIKRAEDRIKNASLVIRGIANAQGEKAFFEFANRLPGYFDVLESETYSRSDEDFIKAMNSTVGEFVYVLITLKIIGDLSKNFESESVEYLKNLYIVSCAEIFRSVRSVLIKVQKEGRRYIKGGRDEVYELGEFFDGFSEGQYFYDKVLCPGIPSEAIKRCCDTEDQLKYVIDLNKVYF